MSDLNLGGPVITNSMTRGQLLLLAKCTRQALECVDFRRSLSEEELEEAESLAEMFEDPDLEHADSHDHHGFCL